MNTTTCQWCKRPFTYAGEQKPRFCSGICERESQRAGRISSATVHPQVRRPNKNGADNRKVTE